MQVFVFMLITQISEDTLTGEEISIKMVTDHLYFKVIGAEIQLLRMCSIHVRSYSTTEMLNSVNRPFNRLNVVE